VCVCVLRCGWRLASLIERSGLRNTLGPIAVSWLSPTDLSKCQAKAAAADAARRLCLFDTQKHLVFLQIKCIYSEGNKWFVSLIWLWDISRIYRCVHIFVSLDLHIIIHNNLIRSDYLCCVWSLLSAPPFNTFSNIWPHVNFVNYSSQQNQVLIRKKTGKKLNGKTPQKCLLPKKYIN